MHRSHVRALFDELRPGISLRQLARAADIDEKKLRYYRDRSVDQMPNTAVLRIIARALGCDWKLVVEAYAKDLGLPPWGNSLSDPRDQEDLWRLWQLDEAERESVRNMLKSLTKHAQFTAATGGNEPDSPTFGDD